MRKAIRDGTRCPAFLGVTKPGFDSLLPTGFAGRSDLLSELACTDRRQLAYGSATNHDVMITERDRYVN